MLRRHFVPNRIGEGFLQLERAHAQTGGPILAHRQGSFVGSENRRNTGNHKCTKSTLGLISCIYERATKVIAPNEKHPVGK